ncbi:TPA: tetratricopeptide repeat protein [Legionella pneumophila]|nr:SEL1-like repeat protein [Legionella pneumophila]HCX3330770.1 SEL1-like repeat protein [Legionella pneumophila]
MKKLILILLCIISISLYAENGTEEKKNRDDFNEAYKIFHNHGMNIFDDKIGDTKLRNDLSECSNNGNAWCAGLLGEQYYYKEWYSLAYPQLIKTSKLKEDGWPSFDFHLGYMFSNGLDVLQNDEKALSFFKKSASKGHTDSAINIGDIYYKRAKLLIRVANKLEADNITSNLINAYAWYKIAQALNSTQLNNKQLIHIRDSINVLKQLLAMRSSLNGANDLASQICSTISTCIQ